MARWSYYLPSASRMQKRTKRKRSNQRQNNSFLGPRSQPAAKPATCTCPARTAKQTPLNRSSPEPLNRSGRGPLSRDGVLWQLCCYTSSKLKPARHTAHGVALLLSCVPSQTESKGEEGDRVIGLVGYGWGSGSWRPAARVIGTGSVGRWRLPVIVSRGDRDAPGWRGLDRAGVATGERRGDGGSKRGR